MPLRLFSNPRRSVWLWICIVMLAALILVAPKVLWIAVSLAVWILALNGVYHLFLAVRGLLVFVAARLAGLNFGREK
jgi:hypothetical protein